jgi:hypothetical protein
MQKQVIALIGVLVLGLTLPLHAQDDSTKATASPSKSQPVQSYRLDFAVNEISDGKIINARHYTMNLIGGGSNEIKIGTRVPVFTRTSSAGVQMPNEYQYLDVGTSIWAQLREHGEELILAVRGEVSNLDMTAEAEHGPSLPPVVRQIKISGDTLLVTGKPVVIGSTDDPNSKRQFQLEVTATKLRN